MSYARTHKSYTPPSWDLSSLGFFILFYCVLFCFVLFCFDSSWLLQVQALLGKNIRVFGLRSRGHHSDIEHKYFTDNQGVQWLRLKFYAVGDRNVKANVYVHLKKVGMLSYNYDRLLVVLPRSNLRVVLYENSKPMKPYLR